MIIYTIGTRAHTDKKTQYHTRNVSTMIVDGNSAILIDAGEGLDKSDILGIYKPDYILITHAHEDHIGPVLEELDAPIYAPPPIISLIKKRLNIPDDRLHTIEPCKQHDIGPYKIAPIRTVQSLKAPAFAYYMKIDTYNVLVAHDFFSFMNNSILPKIDIWIADGQSPRQRLIRAANLKKVSHASILDQLRLAQQRGTKLFIVTHIGKQTMDYDDSDLREQFSKMYPNMKIIIARDNMQINTAEQFNDIDNIRNPHSYNPSSLPDDVLADDWRIVNAWYSTMKTKGTDTIGEVTMDELLDIATAIFTEMIKRGFKFHPDKWKPHTRELVSHIHKRLPRHLKDKLDELTTQQIFSLISEARSNTRLYLPHVVGMFRTVETDIPQVYLIGGLVNRGWTDEDIDILILSKYKLPIIEELIKQSVPPSLQDRLHIIYRDPALPLEYLGNYLPLFNIGLLKNDITVQHEELDQLKPFDRFKPMKSSKGYHAAEYYDPVDLWEYWAKGYIEEGRALYVQPKYDGIRGIIEKKGDKVEIFTEDTMQDISWRLPTLVEQVKRIPHDFILDCELVEWEPGFKRPRPREDMTWMATSKDVPEDREKWVRANVFDVLYWDGRDITSLPLSERQDYLKHIPKSKNIRVSPSKIVKNKAQLWKAIAWAKDNFPESEGAMIKVADSPYLVGKKNVRRTPLWSKIKQAVEISVIVLEKHVVTKNGKPTGAYNYIAGLGIPKKRLDVLNPKDIVEFRGKKYYRIGRTYNTQIDAKPGDILTVIPVYISVKKLRDGKLQIRWMNPSVEHKKLGTKQPDDVDFAISRATLIEGMGTDESLDDYYNKLSNMEPDDEIVILSQPWVIQMLPPCPYYGTEECFLLYPDLNKLGILRQELLIYHVCPHAKDYRCPLIKDYFYVMKLVEEDDDI